VSQNRDARASDILACSPAIPGDIVNAWPRNARRLTAPIVAGIARTSTSRVTPSCKDRPLALNRCTRFSTSTTSAAGHCQSPSPKTLWARAIDDSRSARTSSTGDRSASMTKNLCAPTDSPAPRGQSVDTGPNYLLTFRQ
jgi:hypothetical protein